MINFAQNMYAENNPPLHISLRYSHIISLKSFTDIFMNEPNTDYDIPRMNGRNSRMSWQYPFLFRSFDREKERERESGREGERERARNVVGLLLNTSLKYDVKTARFCFNRVQVGTGDFLVRRLIIMELWNIVFAQATAALLVGGYVERQFQTM